MVGLCERPSGIRRWLCRRCLRCEGSDTVPGFAPAGFVAHLVPATTKPPMSNTRKGPSADDPDQTWQQQSVWQAFAPPPGAEPIPPGGHRAGGALGGASHPMSVFGKAACSQDTAKNVCASPSRTDPRMLSSVVVEQGWLGACVIGREGAAARWCMGPVIRAGRLLLAEVPPVARPTMMNFRAVGRSGLERYHLFTYHPILQ